MDKVVIVMPAWNEAENIKKMISVLIDEVFPAIKADMNLLIVDNHSKDGTDKIVEEASKKYSNVHIVQQDKPGLGWAYVRGMQYAMDRLGADGILEMDADFQHPPRFVKPMVDAFLDGADYCIGSRYVKGGSIPSEWQIGRKAVSFFGNLFIRMVLLNFKIHDLTTGFRLARVKGVLEKIDLEKLMDLDRFAYKVDLLYQCLKNSKKTVEVPLQFAPRTQEKSKFNYKEMIATFRVAIVLGIKDKIRFIKFGTVGFTGYLVNALTLEIFSRTQLVANIASNFGFAQDTFARVLTEPSAWAALLSTEVAIMSNFTFNNIWTFSEVKITKPIKIFFKFLQFNLSSMGALIIQFLVIGGAVMIFEDTRLVRQVALFVSMPLVLSFNYVMYNLFIWKTWKLPWAKKSQASA
jgi:dolichol-phosphate mannosyltransferase